MTVVAKLLRTGVDLDEVIELIYAPLYYRLLIRNQPITADQPASILDQTFMRDLG